MDDDFKDVLPIKHWIRRDSIVIFIFYYNIIAKDIFYFSKFDNFLYLFFIFKKWNLYRDKVVIGAQYLYDTSHIRWDLL
jgi:hypothetical protein